MIALVTVGQFILSILGAGTVGGLASGELNRLLAVREARKKNLNGLLCDLLELRYEIIAIRESTKALTALIPGGGDELTVVLPAASEIFIKTEKLHEHYESAVVELSHLDPILAYHLRAKNLAGTMLGTLSKKALQDPATIPLAAQAFKIFQNVGSSVLDEAIQRVADQLGRKMRRQTRDILNDKPAMPEPVNQIFALVPAFIQAAQRAQTQASQAAEAPVQGNENSAAKAAKSPE
jgi:hypothetical protein